MADLIFIAAIAAFLAVAGLYVVACDRIMGLTVAVPVDAVAASGSAARVATARGMAVDQVLAAVDRHTQARQWGFLGEKVVNVLELNLDLDGRSR